MFGKVDQAKMQLSFSKMAERRFKAIGRQGLSSFVDLSVGPFSLPGKPCKVCSELVRPVVVAQGLRSRWLGRLLARLWCRGEWFFSQRVG